MYTAHADRLHGGEEAISDRQLSFDSKKHLRIASRELSNALWRTRLTGPSQRGVCRRLNLAVSGEDKKSSWERPVSPLAADLTSPSSLCQVRSQETARVIPLGVSRTQDSFAKRGPGNSV